MIGQGHTTLNILCFTSIFSWFWGLSPVFMGVVIVVVDCICEIFISMSSCRQYVCWLTFYSIGKVPLLHTHFRWRHILNINRCHKFLDQISNQGLFPMTASFVTEHGKWTWGYNLCTSSLSFEAPDKHWDTVYSGAHATAQHTGHTGLQLETMSQALFRGLL